ncbi:hypothetical protein Tco_0578128 [Tanacetum coccineum]
MNSLLNPIVLGFGEIESLDEVATIEKKGYLSHGEPFLVIFYFVRFGEESVGSHAPRVILFGAIPAIIPVIPKVPIIPTNPLVAPELKAMDEVPEPGKQRPERHESLAVHDAVVLRWRDRVASRPSSPSGSSSHDTLAPSSEFPLALVVASPEIRQWLAILIRPDLHEDVYLIIHRIVILHQILLQAHLLLIHLCILHRILLLVHFQIHYQIHHKFILQDVIHLVHLLRSLDSSLPSAEPSRKRCRPPTTLVSSPTPILRSIAPTPANLLPPRKRLRDSHSPEDNKEEPNGGLLHARCRELLQILGEDKRSLRKSHAGGMVEIEVDPRVRPIVVEDVLEHVTANGAVEITYEPLGDLIQRFHDHAEEIPVGRIADIETAP